MLGASPFQRWLLPWHWFGLVLVLGWWGLWSSAGEGEGCSIYSLLCGCVWTPKATKQCIAGFWRLLGRSSMRNPSDWSSWRTRTMRIWKQTQGTFHRRKPWKMAFAARWEVLASLASPGRTAQSWSWISNPVLSQSCEISGASLAKHTQKLSPSPESTGGCVSWSSAHFSPLRWNVVFLLCTFWCFAFKVCTCW